MHRSQREPDEECARSWTYKLQGSGQTAEICFLPSGENRSSHRFPSCKKLQQDEHVKESATEMEVENVLYHQVVAVGPAPSLFKVGHDGRPYSHDVADDLKKRQHRQLFCNKGTTKTGL